jgi:hypothetical protein
MYGGRRQGRSRPRILYWFRTPPGVKVGRAALDEHAIRWIEEQNPDITFDWPRILEAKAPPAPPPEDARFRRSRRAPERRSAPRPPTQPVIPAEVPEPATESPDVLELDEVGASEDAIATESEVPLETGVELQGEQLVRLRARYAEILARITERGGDPERIVALRAQAEPLNPDTWVTSEDVRTGIEGFEQRIQELRAALGLQRRRRSRRGGRRRRGGGGGGGGSAVAVPAETPPETSNESQD